jgi:hypothetical protein
MKLRHLKRQQIERLRWRLLLQRVTEGVERCLIDLVAERCARTAAEVIAAAYRRQAKPGRAGERPRPASVPTTFSPALPTSTASTKLLQCRHVQRGSGPAVQRWLDTRTTEPKM